MVSVTMGRNASMARGVKTLLTRLRICRCSGGSMMMIIFAIIGSSDRTVARSRPYADE